MAALTPVVSVALLLFCALSAAAQPSLLNLAADDAEALPLWDAVEHFRQQPLCLRASAVDDLVLLPGITRPLAARMLRVAAKHPTWTVERIADSLCLSLPQRLMLMLCVTTLCDTTQWSFASSLRLSSADDATSRLSLRYGSWRLDALASRSEHDPPVVGHVGASIRTHVAGTEVLLGDVRPRVGTGLIMGSAGASYGGVAPPSDDPFTVRAWTSRQRRGFLRGGAVCRRDTFGSRVLHSLAAAGARTLLTRVDAEQRVVRIDDAASMLASPPEGSTAVRESVFGGSIALADTDWFAGAAAWSILYDHPLHTAAATDVVGSGGLSWSLYGGTFRETDGVAWEAAVDARGRTGVVIQGSLQVAPTQLHAAVRWLSAGYRAPFGDAPSTSAAASNEFGLTCSAALRPRVGTRVDVVIDVRRTLDRTYAVPRPVRGVSLDVMARQRLSRSGAIHLRGRIDNADDAVRADGIARTLTAFRTRLRLRLGMDWQSSLPLTVTCGLHANHARWSGHHAPINGYALTVRCRYRPWPWLGILAQQSMYDASGIDAAAYVSESPMPGMLRTPVLVGRGTRSLVGLRLQLLPTISLWAAAVNAERERRIDVMMQWRIDGIAVSATDQEFVGGNLTDEGLGDGQ